MSVCSFPRSRRAALVAVLVSAWAGPALAQPTRPTPQFEASTNIAVALRTMKVADVMAQLAPDALLLPAGMPFLSTRPEIEAGLKKLFATQGVQISIVSLGSEAGELIGYDSGTYEVTLGVPGGNKVKQRGNYLATYRSIEAKWSLVRLVWAPAAPSPK